MASSVIEVTDFSSGEVDAYLDGPVTAAQEIENFYITNNNQKLKQRYGLNPLHEDFNGALTAGVTIKNIFVNEELLWAIQGNKVFLKQPDNTGVQIDQTYEIEGKATSEDNEYTTTALWRGQVYATRGDYTIPFKMFLYNATTGIAVTAGVPAIIHGATLVFSKAGSGTTYAFIYAVIPVITYSVYINGDSQTFRIEGKPEYFEYTSYAHGGGNSTTLTGFKIFNNTNASENWYEDDAFFTYEIYRTEKNETTLYLVASIGNGTTSYVDTTTDATLADNQTLYTEADTVENCEPPMARTLDVCNDVLFLGDCYVRSRDNADVVTYEYYPNRVYHSIPGNLDHFNQDFYVEVESRVTRVSHIGRIPIIFCATKIYRVDGSVDEFGAGSYTTEKISDSIGSLFPQSMVQVGDSLFFVGTDGFYVTDGYKVQKISNHRNEFFKSTYGAMTTANKLLIQGVHNPDDQLIIWTGNRDAATYNNFFYVLDLSQGVSEEMPFVQWGSKSYDENYELNGDRFLPTALCFFEGETNVAGKFIYDFDTPLSEVAVFAFDETSTSDATNSSTKLFPIMYKYKSPAFSLGSNTVRKYVTKALLTFGNHDDISVRVQSNNNDGTSVRDLKPVRVREGIIWHQSPIEWGDPTFVWDYQAVFERMRRFPARDLRCTYKQIILSNEFTVVQSSDTIGTATTTILNVNSNQILLNNASDYSWDGNALNYFVSFSNDSYVRQYPVTAYSASTLTYTDQSKASPISATVEWLLRGYRVGEVAEIFSYVLYFTPIGASQRSYHTGDSGENA